MEIPDFTDTENSGNIIKETRTSKRKNLNPEVDKKVVIPHLLFAKTLLGVQNIESRQSIYNQTDKYTWYLSIES